MQPGRANLVPALAIGVAVALLASVLLLLPGGFAPSVQFTLADFLLIREGGPLLGVRPARSDIALVHWDERSQQELGAAHPTLDQDLQLYRQLAAAGARAIGDTRALYSWEENLGPFMEQLLANRQRTPTLRDVNPGKSDWFAGREAQLQPAIGHSPLEYDSALDPTLRVRFYPVAVFDPNEGYDETMALKLARIALGAPTPDQLPMRETGVTAIWAIDSGVATDETLPAPLRESLRNPRPYPLDAQHEVRWTQPPNKPPRYVIAPVAVWINFTGRPGGFASISYVEALQGLLSAGALAGKTIIVGDGLETGDRFAVPTSLSRRATRAEIVGQTLQTILDGAYIEPMPLSVSIGAVWIITIGTALAMGILRPLAGAGVGLILLLGYLVIVTSPFRANRMPDVMVPPGALAAALLLVGGYRYAREELARRRVADLFGRYVPRAVVAELLQKPADQAAAMSGVTREITVLFADIRGFTAFSERFAAQEVLERLNALLGVMVGCAFRNEGTVDKFIGDAIMVIFNAPLAQSDHVERAVRTALEMQMALAERDPELAFGIGIHTGEAVVGTVGTPERMEYTAIGATVNLASRLCDTARRGEVIVSAEVYERLGDLVKAEARLPIRVKNIDRDLATYLVSELAEDGPASARRS